MSARREALRGRFRAATGERIGRIGMVLRAAAEGHATAEQLQEVARDLHTIKGESRMLGLSEVSDAVHAVEELLGGGAPPPEACAQVLLALDAVAAVLRSEAGGGAARPATAADRPAPAHPPPAEDHDDAGRAPAAVAAPAVAARQRERWVQVNAARVDEICDRVAGFEGEIRALFASCRAAAQQEEWGRSPRFRCLVEGLARGVVQLEDISGAAWALRLVPLEPLFVEVVKHAHEIAASQGKRLRTSVKGGDAQIERSVLDSLWEPLLHLVRNSIDHGLETPAERGEKAAAGQLSVAAAPEGKSVVITVADDGRGIDPELVRRVAVARGLLPDERAAAALPDEEAVELVFAHGFSTRSAVSDLSGRGVGLDAVRAAIERLGGAVTLTSKIGRGTRFALTVPVTVSKEHAVVFACGGVLYALPSHHVAEVVRVADYPVEAVSGGRVLRRPEGAVPLRSMAGALLGTRADDEPWALLTTLGGRTWAFAVHSLLGERELIRQPADALVMRLGCFGASATLDDGRLVLLLSPAGLVRRAEGHAAPRSTGAPARRRTVLVVDDSPIIRDLVSQVLLGGGLQVREAPEGGAALRELEAAAPDVVLLDVDMPGMSGFELLEQIRARWQRLPVIMFTTRFSPDDQRRAVALGADAYLIKSQFQEAALLETVQRFAGARA